ncbi:MAG: xanthine dehydrogenase family protein subunit M [Reyranellaceae bacterium]
MKPPAFAYASPRTVDECLALKAEHGEDARFIAGGQSLMPLLSLRMVRPAVVIDLGRVRDLAYWRREGDEIVIGAMLRQRVLERDTELAKALPLLAEAVQQIGHPATRSRGTIVGSLCHADPAAELPVCALLLKAQIVLASTRGRRTIAAEDFLVDALSTSIADDELVEQVRLPAARPGTGYAFLELARRHGDFALISVAASVSPDGARVAIGGLGSAPMAFDLQASDVAVESQRIAQGLQPPADLHASAEYRCTLAQTLIERALAAAARRSKT